jgi:hypothetical protein
LLELLPFSSNLPLHRFICAVQFGGVLLVGLALAHITQWLATTLPAKFANATIMLAATVVLSPAIVATVLLAVRNERWQAQAAAADAAFGPPIERALDDFALANRVNPGRGYAGASWDWGRDFKLGGGNVFHRWTRHDLPAIAYMYHTMGLLSDLEPSFDPTRRDHYELFNVRFLLADKVSRLPAFAHATRQIAPGLVSGLVDTAGYFGIARTEAFFDYRKRDAIALHNLNKEFIAGNWHAKECYVRIGIDAGDTPMHGEATVPASGVFDFTRAPNVYPPAGTVLASEGHGDRYTGHVRLDAPAVIVFRMTYHPNWHARIDGKDVATMMLSPGYVGVRAARGEHVLEMSYQSPPWTRTLLWTGLGFFLLVLLFELRTGVGRRR